MNNNAYRRWQEAYVKRALMLLPIGYIMKKLHEYNKPVSAVMRECINWRLRQG